MGLAAALGLGSGWALGRGDPTNPTPTPSANLRAQPLDIETGVTWLG